MILSSFRRAGAVLLLAVFVAATAPVAVALDFPPLTGRVVDNADLLSADQERRLTAKLESHEQATSNQLIVATLTSLQGTTIEDLGYQLGRHWGIGQEGRDNGVLLIVAPKERKVRIEVGYGLEGDLPDAIAKTIIENDILPAFRQGEFPRGINAGVDAIVLAIAGAYEPQEKKDPGTAVRVMLAIIIVSIVLLIRFLLGRLFHLGRRTFFGSTGSSSGGGGGGFSGGGGGFGGGGSSGRW